jgi:hypothetical protein
MNKEEMIEIILDYKDELQNDYNELLQGVRATRPSDKTK